MKPYLLENRFSHLEDMRVITSTVLADIEAPNSAFEQDVRSRLAQARTYHLEDELGLALDGYQQLQALILKTLHPTLQVEVSRHPSWTTLLADGLHESLISAAAAALAHTPAPLPTVPPGVVGPDPVPDAVAKALAPFAAIGLESGVTDVGLHMRSAAQAVEQADWAAAAAEYQAAMRAAPQEDLELQGHLTRDLAVLTMRGGGVERAGALMQRATALFAKAQSADGQVAALNGLADVQTRLGQTDAATKTAAQATQLAARSGLIDVEVASTRSLATGALESATPLSGRMLATRAGLASVTRTLPPRLDGNGNGHAVDMADGGGSPPAASGELLTLRYLDSKPSKQVFSALDERGTPVQVELDDQPAANLTAFYESLQTTSDLALLHPQRQPIFVFVAYIPYVYFYVLPMSIGDCLAAMGDYAGAEQQYLAALQYPYLNPVQMVDVWTRLADVYLAQADSAYRAARDDLAAIAACAAAYSRILMPDGSVPAGSHLYAPPAFGPMTARVQAIVAAAAPETLDENPEIIRRVLQVRLRHQQIAAGLDFFGFPPDYVPPFGFEYLQNSARYFAQHAATLEQSYISFKSQAENEEFRREQLDQQAELARASVELEQRGVDEAQAGVAVAQAGVSYANVQHQNAVQAQQDFANTRGELLELAGLEAWSQAAAQDQDDEVRQSISGYTYYNVDSKRRSLVVQDLETRRTLISQNLEANRLARDVASAASYRGVAQAQLAQAQAQAAVAQQRVVVAQLQQRQAEENRDFLDMKEFSARLWYQLAQTMRSLSQDYLDMATQIAALMERAYTAETGRNLHKIGFDYRNVASGGLLGADTLQRDIDYFTFDRITTTTTKKAPLKVALSLADLYPSAFRSLVAHGIASFETTLEQFDRAYPGYYLHKVRNVEVLLVGVTNGAGIHGTLRNIGVSSFRDAGGAVRTLVYPADVMPLSMYDVRADAVVFQPTGETLRLFENNGLATMWQLELPPGSNELDLNQLIDVQLVLAFDAFFDPALETAVKAALPTSGDRAKATSLRVVAPDELFFLRRQGEATVPFAPADFPRNETARARTSSLLMLTGDPAVAGGLVLRVTPQGGATLTVTTAADGSVAGAAAGDPLGALIGGDPALPWEVAALAADNPGRPAVGTAVDLQGLTDLQIYQEYTFTYR